MRYGFASFLLESFSRIAPGLKPGADKPNPFSYQGLFEGYRIYSILADGSQSEPVFLSDGLSPAWAPDGQFVAIVFRTGGTIIGFTPHIALLTPDGSFYKEITGSNDQGYSPSWSPVISAQQPVRLSPYD